MAGAQPGHRVGGRYRLAGTLGSGGFGQVWKAHDERLGVDVAVKEMWLPPMAEAEREQRLVRAEREARNAAGLRDHPNIVAVYDVVVEDGTPWIVMRLVTGRSLEDRLEDGPLPSGEVARVALGLLGALGAAHAAGIVHRDVKPANVLLSDAGEVLLTDFGIAVHEGDETLTATGALIGSSGYIAPERIDGSPAHAAGDLFSLGVTLYRAVEGVSPFRRDTPSETLIAVLMHQPPPPARADPALTRLIAALLEKDPANRATVEQAQTLLADPPQPPTTPNPFAITPTPQPYGAPNQQPYAATPEAYAGAANPQPYGGGAEAYAGAANPQAYGGGAEAYAGAANPLAQGYGAGPGPLAYGGGAGQVYPGGLGTAAYGGGGAAGGKRAAWAVLAAAVVVVVAGAVTGVVLVSKGSGGGGRQAAMSGGGGGGTCSSASGEDGSATARPEVTRVPAGTPRPPAQAGPADQATVKVGDSITLRWTPSARYSQVGIRFGGSWHYLRPTTGSSCVFAPRKPGVYAWQVDSWASPGAVTSAWSEQRLVLAEPASGRGVALVANTPHPPTGTYPADQAPARVNELVNFGWTTNADFSELQIHQPDGTWKESGWAGAGGAAFVPTERGVYYWSAVANNGGDATSGPSAQHYLIVS